MNAPTARADHSGLVWLMSDMVLVTIMTVLVKIGGATYPALQMVFIRSLIGLVSVLPLAWRHRAAIRSTKHVGRHIFRVFCNTLALSTNFAALTALPLAMANAIGFMRPLVVMVLASVLLSERSTVWRWVGASVGFVGVIIMVAPGDVAFNPGILAALGSVVFGSLAVIQTRALARENTTVLMVFYTVGLTVFTAIPAAIVWEPVQFDDWGLLLAIGILAQVGQYCFLRAYQSTPANILAPFGYLSIVLATFAGYVALNEVPSWTTLVGIAIIIGALAATSRLDRRKLQKDAAHDREL
ncbi:multidrug transporter [Devosia epidermidihirudinis]|uniref:Multidrug transporter n=1 Tax=Devosia epidermidihirudinis TaxID=1293439 RepID=A0A0F5QG65_9HYPH|nr:DMT family transporter [Devosia epidermidihirudinis]KKC39726.1 multidrug transporter [Devosia epidermidihirudinis]